jgi:hypothetical protein
VIISPQIDRHQWHASGCTGTQSRGRVNPNELPETRTTFLRAHQDSEKSVNRFSRVAERIEPRQSLLPPFSRPASTSPAAGPPAFPRHCYHVSLLSKLLAHPAQSAGNAPDPPFVDVPTETEPLERLLRGIAPIHRLSVCSSYTHADSLRALVKCPFSWGANLA